MSSIMQPYFFIRSNNQCVKINFHEICYLEANRNYVRIVLENKVHMALLSLKQLESILPSNLFCRIHRSHIVSLDKVAAFDMEILDLHVGLKRIQLPIGHQYRKCLLQKITLVSSDVRNGLKLGQVDFSSIFQEAN